MKAAGTGEFRYSRERAVRGTSEALRSLGAAPRRGSLLQTPWNFSRALTEEGWGAGFAEGGRRGRGKVPAWRKIRDRKGCAKAYSLTVWKTFPAWRQGTERGRPIGGHRGNLAGVGEQRAGVGGGRVNAGAEAPDLPDHPALRCSGHRDGSWEQRFSRDLQSPCLNLHPCIYVLTNFPRECQAL